MVSNQATPKIEVEVVYIEPGFQFLRAVSIDETGSIQQAIELSGLHQTRPDLVVDKVGIFGKLVDLNHGLTAGDRIEVYRPLIFDPKEARRKRAAKQ